MTALNLFPSRVRFVNQDGTLTPEALRLLEILRDRVGGMLGDMGADVFGALLQDPPASHATVVQPQQASAPSPEMLMQPAGVDQRPPDIVQQPLDYSADTGLSLANMRFSLKDTAVTPDTYGDSTHVTQFTVDQQGRITAATSVPIAFPGGANFSGSFTGKTVTVVNGIITSVV